MIEECVMTTLQRVFPAFSTKGIGAGGCCLFIILSIRLKMLFRLIVRSQHWFVVQIFTPKLCLGAL